MPLTSTQYLDSSQQEKKYSLTCLLKQYLLNKSIYGFIVYQFNANTLALKEGRTGIETVVNYTL